MITKAIEIGIMIVLVITTVIACLYIGTNIVMAQKTLSKSTPTEQKGKTSLSNTTGGIVSLQKGKTSLSNTTGGIVSLQNGQDGKPKWIVPGKWQMVVINPQKLTGNHTNNTAPKIIFNASFGMTSLDGITQYRHNDISNFKLTGNPVNTNKTNILNGTVTVSLNHGGRTVYHLVPISIKIMNNSTMSMWLNPEFVEHQLGSPPIYGNAKVSPSTSKITSVQISK
ncbi:MAG TPA: hypothetical protein VE076_13495 [Nitrososphaeraceae archaeon]|nr:hypothetical protein [Nitrososphaeraceae archaeon]